MPSGKSIFDVIGAEPMTLGVAPLQPMPAPAPPRQTFFGEGGLGRYLAGALGDALAQRAGLQPVFASAMQARQKAEQEEAQWTRRQQSELDQYRQKKTIDQQFPSERSPYRTQDNAGNVWEQQPNGEFKRVFTDMAPKQYVQDGMLVTVPNPYNTAATPPAPAAAPPTIDEDLWNTGKPVGGATVPPSRTFRR